MAEDVLGVLMEAVQSRRSCVIRYRDQTQARVVEPHAIYEDASGEVIVDCYQVGGFSSADRTPPFWRPFRLRKIAAVALLKETFVPRRSEGFSPARSRYRKGLICAVAGAGAYATALAPLAVPVGPSLPTKSTRR